MQQFQTSYTVYFNRRHDRVGHLFSGRFKAKVVEGGHYLLGLTRYVHLNPVRTKRFETAPFEARQQQLHTYRWSSFPDYVGLRPPASWLDYSVLEAFTDLGADAERRRGYLRFVEDCLDEDDPELLAALRRSSKAIGSEAFCREAENRHHDLAVQADRYVDIARRKTETPLDLEQMTAAVMREYTMEKEELLRRGNREAKDVWIRLAQSDCGLTQREIGVALGHTDGATVSRRLAALSKGGDYGDRVAASMRSVRGQIANYKA
jgi:hypothetical protein